MIPPCVEDKIYKSTRKALYTEVVKLREEYKRLLPSASSLLADILLTSWLPIAQRYAYNCALCKEALERFSTRQDIVRMLGKFSKYVPATWELDHVPSKSMRELFSKSISNKLLIEAEVRTFSGIELEVENPYTGKTVVSVRGNYTFFINPWTLLTRPAVYSTVDGEFKATLLGTAESFDFSLGGELGGVHFSGNGELP